MRIVTGKPGSGSASATSFAIFLPERGRAWLVTPIYGVILFTSGGDGLLALAECFLRKRHKPRHAP